METAPVAAATTPPAPSGRDPGAILGSLVVAVLAFVLGVGALAVATGSLGEPLPVAVAHRRLRRWRRPATRSATRRPGRDRGLGRLPVPLLPPRGPPLRRCARARVRDAGHRPRSSTATSRSSARSRPTPPSPPAAPGPRSRRPSCATTTPSTRSSRARTRAASSRANLLQIAEIAGVPDTTAFEACLDDPAVAAAVAEETTAGRNVGISSTPTLRLRGPGGERVLTGFSQTWPPLREAVEAVRVAATASPSPGGSATPAPPSTSAPTPGASAPTPAASAPTPSTSAPTPGASAPTPGASASPSSSPGASASPSSSPSPTVTPAP